MQDKASSSSIKYSLLGIFCILDESKPMLLYNGPYLTIEHDLSKDRFIQHWKISPENSMAFKSEMLSYVKLYEELRVAQTLWIQENFTLELDRDTQFWIEEYVNVPCKAFGNKKIAFVVSKDLLAHIKVSDSFKETNSCLIPRHFATRHEAENWLNDLETNNLFKPATEVLFEGVDEDGNAIIKMKHAASEIVDTIRLFKSLVEENQFMKDNFKKYASLTEREQEILMLYASGLKHKEIAEKLFVSVFTIQTHWRNIKRKLEIEAFADIIKYVRAFGNN